MPYNQGLWQFVFCTSTKLSNKFGSVNGSVKKYFGSVKILNDTLNDTLKLILVIEKKR